MELQFTFPRSQYAVIGFNDSGTAITCTAIDGKLAMFFHGMELITELREAREIVPDLIWRPIAIKGAAHIQQLSADCGLI